MESEDVQKVFDRHWNRGWGSIALREALFIQDLIRAERPERFLEIGAASGLSGGLICRMLAENGGREFTTYDYQHEFFGDRSKAAGYLIEEIYQGDEVSVTKRFGKTSLDLPDHGESYDMAFIDANHQHPWPLIDTLFVAPALTGKRRIVHHDLRLYRIQPGPIGIGPKYLFDQFPEAHRILSEANHRNIFAIDLSMSQAELTEIAIAGFLLPWSLMNPLGEAQLERIRKFLREGYGTPLVEAFDTAASRYNFPVPGYAPEPVKVPMLRRLFVRG